MEIVRKKSEDQGFKGNKGHGVAQKSHRAEKPREGKNAFEVLGLQSKEGVLD